MERVSASTAEQGGVVRTHSWIEQAPTDAVEGPRAHGEGETKAEGDEEESLGIHRIIDTCHCRNLCAPKSKVEEEGCSDELARCCHEMRS